MISLKNFSIGFEGRILLKDVTMSFEAEKLTALIGRNGTGKSTLLRAICGLNKNYRGEVLIEGRNLRQLTSKYLASLIAYVNTSRPRISNLTCRNIVALGRSPYTDWMGRLSPEDRREVDKALGLVDMLPFADRPVDSLSDGECQRVMIARAIAQNTKAIILDEPTSFLDMPTRYELVAILKDIAHTQGKTIIFSTHELDIVMEMSDYVALIDDEKLRYLDVDSLIEGGYLQRLFKMPGDYLERLFRIRKG